MCWHVVGSIKQKIKNFLHWGCFQKIKNFLQTMPKLRTLRVGPTPSPSKKIAYRILTVGHVGSQFHVSKFRVRFCLVLAMLAMLAMCFG
jgi:hypothetical protein